MALSLILNTNKKNIPNIEISPTINIIPAHLTILHNTLPKNYNYVDSFKTVQHYSFLGAQEEPFKLKLHMNTCTVESTIMWFNEFTDLHKVTMRETQGRPLNG
ncbi:3502_t:CDS:1, partial [Gigaspora rosea]